MSTSLIVPLTSIFLVGFGLAYFNGANDVSKGIATLVGSGVTNYRRAVAWGTIWTGIGGVLAALTAEAMLRTFNSLSHESHMHTPAVVIATMSGAVLWIAIATFKGLPVSTTHAIVGAITAVAVFTGGLNQVDWRVLTGRIGIPMLVSPILALVLTSAILKTWRALVPVIETDCLCIENQLEMKVLATGGATLQAPIIFVEVKGCNSAVQATTGVTIGHLHWLTSGLTSFARGLNDAPKIAVLLLGAATLSGAKQTLPVSYFAVIVFGMMSGSWIAGQRVTELLARKVTPMDHRQGFAANLVTACLVGIGAPLGLPLSTTHVASGAVLGIAIEQNMPLPRRLLAEMILAWVVTIPVAGLLSVAVLMVLTKTPAFTH
jgi:Phosphate/sulphate permeases